MNNHFKNHIRSEWELLKKLSTTKFVTASSSGSCSSIVSSKVCLKETGIKCVELIELGAIYVKSASDIRPRRILSDVHVSEGDLIRVHPYPRRYKIVDDIDWRCATIHDSADYVIINKPAGVPSHPTLDNYYENVFVRAKSEMKHEGTLYLPHRLDTDTSGLLLLGKSKKFASYFGSLLRLRQNVTKKYRAIIASTSSNNINDVLLRINKENIDKLKAEVHQNGERMDILHPRGLLITNYLEKTSRTPKKFSEVPMDDSLLCQLILSSNSQPLTLSVYEWRKWSEKIVSGPKYDQAVRDHFSNGFNNWLQVNQSESSISSSILPQHLNEHIEDENKRYLTFWDVDIQLLTGRTHQCRGQMNVLGPDIHIAGDNMYVGTTTPLVPDGYQSSAFLALQAYHLSFKVVADKDHSGSIPISNLQSSIVSYELENSWWQPLSDLLKERSAHQQ